MLKKISLAIPLLLCAQSTGYAASAAMKEVFEFGVPAARRVLSTVRPLASLFTFQPPVPLASPPSYVTRRYFSKMSDLADVHGSLDKSLDTCGTFPVSATDTAGELAILQMLQMAPSSDESGKVRPHTKKRPTSVKVGGDEFLRQLKVSQKNCFPTLKKAFPQYVDDLNEIESTLCSVSIYADSPIEKISNRIVSQVRESAEQWHAIAPKIVNDIEKLGTEGDLKEWEGLMTSKRGVDQLFAEAIKI